MSRPRAAVDDGAPQGGKPVILFLGPAMLEALALQADDEGVQVQDLLRRGARLVLRQAAAGGAS